MKQQLMEKLANVERTMSQERGALALFALFLRENSSMGTWDLLVAAPWLNRSTRYKEGLEYVADHLRNELTTREMVSLSRIVVLDWDDPHMNEAYDLADVEHGLVEFRDRDVMGQTIKHGYIITSKKAQPLAA